MDKLLDLLDFLMVALVFLLVLMFTGAVVFVVLHFIIKYW